MQTWALIHFSCFFKKAPPRALCKTQEASRHGCKAAGFLSACRADALCRRLREFANKLLTLRRMRASVQHRGWRGLRIGIVQVRQLR